MEETPRELLSGNKRTFTRKRVYLAVFCVLLLLAGIFFYAFRITTVEVVGSTYYTEEEIRERVMGSPLDSNSLLLYMKYRYIGIKEIPFVEKVTITRKGNHKVVLHVYEKSLTASVKYMGQYVYFDKDGIVLESQEEPIEGIPCIEGIPFSGFVLYEKLKVKDDSIFNRILDLSQLLSKYELDVEEICFNDEGDVILKSGNVKVYLGNREFYDEQIVALSEIFPKALEQNLSGEIDMENYSVGDEVIFKKREF